MRKKILVDAKAIITLPTRHYGDSEAYARELEVDAKELEAFLRDHRSRDSHFITIEREYTNNCEFCGFDPEEDHEGQPCCCNKAIEEWEAIERQKV